MEISELRERIEALQKGMTDIEGQIRTLDANRHATSGAIQEAQFWLKVLLAEKLNSTKALESEETLS